jgi:hypothetical protein
MGGSTLLLHATATDQPGRRPDFNLKNVGKNKVVHGDPSPAERRSECRSAAVRSFPARHTDTPQEKH